MVDEVKEETPVGGLTPSIEETFFEPEEETPPTPAPMAVKAKIFRRRRS